MLIFIIIIYTLFGLMCLWFIISGVRKINEVKASQALSEFYTNEEEHNQAIKEAQEFEKGYFERIRQGEQSQQFLAVGSFAVSSFLRSLLAAENIPTYTENEHINSMYALNVLGGSSSFSIKVFILISDYDRAHEIIYDFISSHQASPQDKPSEKAQQSQQRATKIIATGTFFISGHALGTTEEAVHGITILPKLS